MMRNSLKYSGLVICLLLMGYAMIKSYKIGGNDFANSYFGASFFVQGKFDLEVFDPYTFNKRIYDDGHPDFFLNYNPNPPSTAVFFAPFAFLPLDASKFLFNVLSCFLFLFSSYRICKYLELDRSVIMLCIPIVFLIPIHNQIVFGQTYFLIFALVIEGFLAHKKNNNVVASVLWSTAIFIKVFPGILVLYLILKKEWRSLIYLAAAGGLMLLLFLILQGFEVWKEYLLVVLPRNNQGEIHAAYLTTYQSALMLFKYLFVKEEVLNPNPLVDSVALFNACLVVFKAFVLTLSTIIVIHRKDVIALGVVLLCGILISPYGSTYSNILLLILLIGIRSEMNEKFFWWSAILIFLIGNMPTHYFEQLPVLVRFPRLILMCGLLVLIFLIGREKVIPKLALLYLFLLGIPAFIKSNPIQDLSKRLLSKEMHNLIYDYEVKNGFLVYSYWDGHPSFHETNISVTEIVSENVSIANNQIFFNGKQLTYGPDNKSKVSIINKNSLIYLSDKGKGIGFYTIRVIALE